MDMRRRRESPGASASEALLEEGKAERAPASQSSVSGAPQSVQEHGTPSERERDPGEPSGLGSSGGVAAVSPFWSPRAKAEAELHYARPKHLAEEERRRGETVLDGIARPSSLAEKIEETSEAKMSELAAEPTYSPASRLGSGVEIKASAEDAQEETSLVPYVPSHLGRRSSQEAVPGDEQPHGEGRSPRSAGTQGTEMVPSSPQPEVGVPPEDRGVLALQDVPPQTGMVPPQGLPAILGPRSSRSQGGTALELEDRRPEAHVQRIEDSVQEGRSRSDEGSMGVAAVADTEFELIRMRSLVEHLADRLEKVEGGRAASFGSASSGRLGWVDHVALEAELSRQSQTREVEAFRQGDRTVVGGLIPAHRAFMDSSSRLDFSNGLPPSFLTPALPLGRSETLSPPLPLPAIPQQDVFQPAGSPQYFALSPRARGGDMSGVVQVQGVDHRWKVINGNLVLEPLERRSFNRSPSPPPRPPVDTPPPSPPGCCNKLWVVTRICKSLCRKCGVWPPSSIEGLHRDWGRSDSASTALRTPTRFRLSQCRIGY